MYYVAVDIGCIECGEVSKVIGIYTDRKEAENVIEDHEERQEDNWHGEHRFEIFEIKEIDKTYEVSYK